MCECWYVCASAARVLVQYNTGWKSKNRYVFRVYKRGHVLFSVSIFKIVIESIRKKKKRGWEKPSILLSNVRTAVDLLDNSVFPL